MFPQSCQTLQGHFANTNVTSTEASVCAKSQAAGLVLYRRIALQCRNLSFRLAIFTSQVQAKTFIVSITKSSAVQLLIDWLQRLALCQREYMPNLRSKASLACLNCLYTVEISACSLGSGQYSAGVYGCFLVSCLGSSS